LQGKVLLDLNIYIDLDFHISSGCSVTSFEKFFNYFNSLCFWTILLKEKVKNWYCFLSNYFVLFEEINDSNLNFSEKIVLLITVTRRALETELHLFPKIK